MTLKQRLDQRQVQKLVLAPALQQAIKLLPLTNLELIEVIDEELAQNPMIEIEDEAREGAAKDSETVAAEEAGVKNRDSLLEGLSLESTEPKLAGDAAADNLLSGFQEYLDEGFRPHFTESRDAVSLENTISRTPSLWDHLNWQASLTFFDPADRELAERIIGDINDDGYLSSTIEELARLNQTTAEKVEAVRAKIKTFDPVGCGSLDLREALLTQMDYLQLQDDLARRIVGQGLPLLEKSDFVQLARVLGASLAEIRERIDLIKTLDPAPGRKYTEEKTSYVVPDIIVDKEDDEWTIALNDEGLPRLHISPYYRQLLAKAAAGEPEAYRFLKDRLKKALWFLRSLDQRNRTIYKVAKFIVDRQKEFFEKGIDYIKPLTLMEIAQDVGVHESTVGRVVANKFMMTPRGVFSLKYFFHKSLQGSYGEDVSSLMVKDRIRKLVEGEAADHPLSDIEIGQLLGRENLRIARRTVAKYRTQLGIEPSHIRKRKSVMEEKA
ncbi:MAG TPA: RNA polymerase factor sigma-54 [Candidatus Aminicenantes bacterium]|nr:RNA polymerase factor sigma-54 [Candidatus Aminicenantes bacterium]HRY64341.1 RNA polymerase factor sigma-54 [Candidatus Aminicenantes bacterium]HRZ71254.1 RNA polymerase factor sigma-54 [Candidatus Aminicenantes bacterium]